MALIVKGNDWLQDEFPAELQFWENMAISRANCQNIGFKPPGRSPPSINRETNLTALLTSPLRRSPGKEEEQV